MQRRKGVFNRKRRIDSQPEPEYCEFLAEHVRYGGNPEHKRNPGDFGLTPPSSPRAHKTLCDDSGVTSLSSARKLLKKACRLGLYSVQRKGQWPQNLWSVTDDGFPLEAQLENAEQGIYHGYPMPESDPLREIVLSRWHSGQ